MTTVIQTSALSKTYTTRRQSFKALSDLTLSVEAGEIFGYLGPNGAGKSTTINLLLDLIRPTSGSASLFGMDSRMQSVDIHRRVGFMPAELSLWKNETAKQIIRDFADLRGNAATQVKEADQLAQRLSLDLSHKIREFSTGNKRKVGLVLALMHRPELLILDEPTSGLDPLLQQTFSQLMLEAKAQGRTVFLSSHVLSEVQAICDRVGILRDGKLKSVESVHTLMASGLRKVTVQLDGSQNGAAAALQGLAGVQDWHALDDVMKFTLRGDLNPLLHTLAGLPVRDVLINEPTLEEVFLAFYGDNGKAS